RLGRPLRAARCYGRTTSQVTPSGCPAVFRKRSSRAEGSLMFRGVAGDVPLRGQPPGTCSLLSASSPVDRRRIRTMAPALVVVVSLLVGGLALAFYRDWLGLWVSKEEMKVEVAR